MHLVHKPVELQQWREFSAEIFGVLKEIHPGDSFVSDLSSIDAADREHFASLPAIAAIVMRKMQLIYIHCQCDEEVQASVLMTEFADIKNSLGIILKRSTGLNTGARQTLLLAVNHTQLVIAVVLKIANSEEFSSMADPLSIVFKGCSGASHN